MTITAVTKGSASSFVVCCRAVQPTPPHSTSSIPERISYNLSWKYFGEYHLLFGRGGTYEPQNNGFLICSMSVVVFKKIRFRNLVREIIDLTLTQLSPFQLGSQIQFCWCVKILKFWIAGKENRSWTFVWCDPMVPRCNPACFAVTFRVSLLAVQKPVQT